MEVKLQSRASRLNKWASSFLKRHSPELVRFVVIAVIAYPGADFDFLKSMAKP